MPLFLYGIYAPCPFSVSLSLPASTSRTLPPLAFAAIAAAAPAPCPVTKHPGITRSDDCTSLSVEAQRPATRRFSFPRAMRLL